MSRALPAEVQTALESDVITYTTFVEIVKPGYVIRLTSGSGDEKFNGETYIANLLTEIGSLNESPTVEDFGLNISFSAVDKSILAEVASGDFVNAAVSIWRKVSAIVDGEESSTGSFLFFKGTVVSATLSYGNNSTVTAVCKSKFAGLNRHRSLRMANAWRQKKYPGDKGYEFAAQVANKDYVWPSQKWFENRSS